MSKLKIMITGNINIYSSGYSDRFICSETNANIEKNGVEFIVDKEDIIKAVLTLENLEDSPKNRDAIKILIDKSELQTWMSATNEKSGSITVKITYSELKDGLDWAIRNQLKKTMREEFWEKIKKPELDKDQWRAIEWRLTEINELHQRNGKELCEFEI